jgi:hypothetical protein
MYIDGETKSVCKRRVILESDERSEMRSGHIQKKLHKLRVSPSDGGGWEAGGMSALPA